jgi:hypothetical protein
MDTGVKKILSPLPGIEPQPSSPQPITILTKLLCLNNFGMFYYNYIKATQFCLRKQCSIHEKHVLTMQESFGVTEFGVNKFFIIIIVIPHPSQSITTWNTSHQLINAELSYRKRT